MKKTDSPRGLLNQELKAMEWSQRDTLAVLRTANQGGYRSMKATMKLALALMIALALMATTALALVGHGLGWYYDNRFPALKEHAPETHEAIMANLQTEVPQWAQEDPEVRIVVAETSWAAAEKVLVVSVLAEAADSDGYELHPMWNLDADGAYMGESDTDNPASDGEDRAVHWLWTPNGFGPAEQMIASGKSLLLLDTQHLYLGAERLASASMDAYVTEEGMIHTVLEAHLDAAQAERLLAADADGNGFVTLTLPYTVTHYTDDDEQLYFGGRRGEIHFDVKIR